MKVRILILLTMLLLLTSCSLNNEGLVSDKENNPANCEFLGTVNNFDRLYKCNFDGQICYYADAFEAAAMDCVP